MARVRMHVFLDLADGPHQVFEDSCMDEEGVREHWHTDEVEQRRSKYQLIEPRFLLHQPSLRQNPTQRHFTNTTCAADIDAGLTGNLHTHLPELLDGLDVEWGPSVSHIQIPIAQIKTQRNMAELPNIDPINPQLSTSDCLFRKISFPRQRAACTTRTSKSCIQTLSGTYKNEKILVANRGEIAVRVIRTAHEMGVPFVVVYSIDRDVLHVPLANEAVCIGEAPSSQSYPVIANVLSAAVSHGCTMLHPGYGFLSEIVGFRE